MTSPAVVGRWSLLRGEEERRRKKKKGEERRRKKKEGEERKKKEEESIKEDEESCAIVQDAGKNAKEKVKKRRNARSRSTPGAPERNTGRAA